MQIEIEDALLIEDRVLAPDVIQALTERFGRHQVLKIAGEIAGTGSAAAIGENTGDMGDEFEGGALDVPVEVDVISDEADDDRLVKLLVVTEDGLEIIEVQLEDTSPGAAAPVTTSKKIVKHGIIGIFAEADAAATITVHEVAGTTSTYITLSSTETATWSTVVPGTGAVIPLENVPLYVAVNNTEVDTGHVFSFIINGQTRTSEGTGALTGFGHATGLKIQQKSTNGKDAAIELKVAILL